LSLRRVAAICRLVCAGLEHVKEILYNYLQNISSTSTFRAKPKDRIHTIALRLASFVKGHTDRTRFDNATRIFSFQKQIKPSTDKNFTIYADQLAKIA
jgi:hypothetical protein